MCSEAGDVLELGGPRGVQANVLDTEEVLAVLEALGEIKVDGGRLCRVVSFDASRLQKRISAHAW